MEKTKKDTNVREAGRKKMAQRSTCDTNAREAGQKKAQRSAANQEGNSYFQGKRKTAISPPIFDLFRNLFFRN